MNYKTSVPVMLNDMFEKEVVLRELKRAKASIVYLILRDRKTESFAISEEECRELYELNEFFTENGIEVGVWVGITFGHTANEPVLPHKYTKPVTSDGRIGERQYCPLDEEYIKDFKILVQDIAKSGIKNILLDDDYCMGSRAGMTGDFDLRGAEGMYCFCEHHMKEYRKIFGDDITPEKIAENAFLGKPNKYRSGWLKVMDYSLRHISEELRAAVDEIDDTVRLGICASPSTWDVDGIGADELAKVLAGNTKPFLRLIGAPYWVSRNYPLSKTLEYERLQQYWTKNQGIEVISEGDSYPRPRYCISAARMELFDTALRAAGSFDGIHKYLLDYCSSCDYETGYVDRHEKNLAVYEQIDKMFSDKKAVGLNIFEKMHLLEDADLSDERFGYSIYPLSQWFVTDNSIPATYGEDGVTVVFGENARHIESFDGGLIINLQAAQILTERGVDVGLLEVGKRIFPASEYYREFNERVGLFCGGMRVYDIKVSDKARVLTTLEKDGGKDSEFIGAYEYENALGQKFLVYPFSLGNPYYAKGLFRSYCRQKQLKKSIEWMGGRIPAYCHGNPDLYMIAKENEKALAVGLWNIFEDSIEKPVVELDKKYSSVKFINCSGELKGNRIELTRMEPFSFAAFEVE